MKILIAALLLVGFSNCEKSSCVTESDSTCTCISVYEPVCGCDDVTYSNSCMASCAGVNTYTDGVCK